MVGRAHVAMRKSVMVGFSEQNIAVIIVLVGSGYCRVDWGFLKTQSTEVLERLGVRNALYRIRAADCCM